MGFAARMHSGLSIAALSLGLLAGCGGGGGGPGPGPGPQPRYDLGITALLAGSPVSGATVLVGLDIETTGADGKASFAQLSAGNYTVSVQGPGGEYACRSVSLAEGLTDFDIPLSAASGFRLASLSPALGSTTATPDPELVLGFSAALDPASVTASSFSFTPSISGLSLVAAGDQLTLRSSRQLPLGQLIVCQLQAGMRSSGGAPLALPVRFAFRTPGTDNAAPRLLASHPADGELGYPPNLAVRLEFNEALGGLDSGFSAECSPPATLHQSASGSSLLISAEGGWALNTTYTFDLRNIPDAAGNTIDIALSFTTSDTPAPADNVQPEWNRVLNEIVFASNLLGSFDIYRISPDGSGLAQLTSTSGDELHPTQSADGLLLAWQAHGEGGDWDVFVGPRSEPALAQAVTSGPSNDFEPAFSRTFSRNIFFTSDRSNPQGLYMMGETGSTPTALDSNFNATSGQPAPHPLLDSQLLFISARAGSTDIWRKTVSAVDGTATNLNLTGDILSTDRSPDWAPDASFIVYISDRSGSDNLWLADASGAVPRQVTALNGGIDDPAVSPFVGSTECAVSVANGLGGRDIMIIDLVGGTVLRNLTGSGDGS